MQLTDVHAFGANGIDLAFRTQRWGRSHCPEENGEASDLAKAVLVAYDAVQTMCKSIENY